MIRYNIFNQIHKGLRALLYDTALKLQQTNFANAEESEAILEQLKQTLDVFDKHAEHEDHVVLPAIQQYEPSIVDAFVQEHILDHQLAEKMRAQLAAFEVATTPADKLNAGNGILHAFIAFMTFNLDHMAKEETVINERLWRYYSDAEIIGMNQRIIANIPPEEMGFTSAWMMKGMNNAEITGWLRAVQDNAPEQVFNTLFTIAEKELPYPRFRKILEDLTEGAMVA